MGNDLVHHPHLKRLFGAVVLAQEEDLSRALLAYLSRQQRRAITAVEAGHVGIGLLEDGVLTTGDRQIAHDVQAVTAADGPTWDGCDHDLGREANQPLHLQDMQSAEPRRVRSAWPFVL